MKSDAGIVACSKYAFAPNIYHYCGPEKQTDLLGYVKEGHADRGLIEILSQFGTLYTYLVLIASENHIPDPFDPRVVEAYWLGNALTLKVKKNAFITRVDESLALRKKMTVSAFSKLTDTLLSNGMPTHTDHVLSIYIRTGHHAIVHTLDTMDQCRISWGKVKRIQGSTLSVQTQPLVYDHDTLRLGMSQLKAVTCIGLAPKIGDWVSIHWEYACAVLSPAQLNNLQQFTSRALRHLVTNV